MGVITKVRSVDTVQLAPLWSPFAITTTTITQQSRLHKHTDNLFIII